MIFRRSLPAAQPDGAAPMQMHAEQLCLTALLFAHLGMLCCAGAAAQCVPAGRVQAGGCKAAGALRAQVSGLACRLADLLAGWLAGWCAGWMLDAWVQEDVGDWVRRGPNAWHSAAGWLSDCQRTQFPPLCISPCACFSRLASHLPAFPVSHSCRELACLSMTPSEAVMAGNVKFSCDGLLPNSDAATGAAAEAAAEPSSGKQAAPAAGSAA